ncbi:hypothetical protein E0Z10_g9887, partial [Xylaria hypoxylon]
MTAQRNCLELTCGEPSNQIPVTSPLNDTFPPVQSNPDLDNSLDTEHVKPFPRTQSRTFPQSNKEKVNNTMPLSSIDARLGKGSTGVENALGPNEGTLRKQLQPVPDDFEGLDKHSKKLYEKHTFDMQMKALEVAVRREQPGKQSIEDSKQFVKIWESELLSRIEQVLDENTKCEYTINVSRGPEPGKRTIVIMTAVLMTDDVERQLRESKSDILPSDLDSTTAIIFRQGNVQFLADPGTSLRRVSSRDSDDSCTSPLNTHWSPDLSIGDSVGWKTESATLGPLLQIDQGFYRLVCWHLFDDTNGERKNERWKDAHPPSGLSTYCPSPSDAEKSGNRDSGHHIGDVVAYSGHMYKTSRLSVSIRQDHVVTDWALIRPTEAIEQAPQPNIVRRRLDGTSTHTSTFEVKQDEDPAFFRSKCEENNLLPYVYSVGRTSGYTTGQLGLTHGSLRLSDGRKTKNWTVENMGPDDKGAVKQWTRAGMGVPGDSGAGVFGFGNNELLGQIWGRNTYIKNDPEPRFTFFTALADIYADILEKMPDASMVRLVTSQTIKDSVHFERGPAAHDDILRTEVHSPLQAISEALVYPDLDDNDLVDSDHEIRHRSAATSRGLGEVMAL